MGDKYLEEIKEIYEKVGKREAVREGYLHSQKCFGDDLSKMYNKAKQIIKFEGGERNVLPQTIGNISQIASKLMSYGIKQKNVDFALVGAELFEKYELGNRTSVKKRLKKAFKSDPNLRYFKDVQEFFKRNPEEERIKGVEKKVLTSVFAISIAVGLLFGVNSMTGAAIGFANAPSGFLGAVLFIGGIAGLFFSKK